MTTLKSLTFTTLPKVGSNPTQDRRANVIARLEDQKLLLSNPNYVRIVRTSHQEGWRANPGQKQQRVLPWWRANANGSHVFLIRSGWKLVELLNRASSPSVTRQAAGDDRHTDRGGAQRRIG